MGLDSRGSVIRHASRMERSRSVAGKPKSMWLLSALDKHNQVLSSQLRRLQNSSSYRLLQIENQQLYETVALLQAELAELQGILAKVDRGEGCEGLWQEHLQCRRQLAQSLEKSSRLQVDNRTLKKGQAQLRVKVRAKADELSRLLSLKNSRLLQDTQLQMQAELAEKTDFIAFLQDSLTTYENTLSQNRQQIDLLNAKVLELNQKLVHAQEAVALGVPVRVQAKTLKDVGTSVEPPRLPKKSIIRKHELQETRLLLVLHLIEGNISPQRLSDLLWELLPDQPSEGDLAELLAAYPFSLPGEHGQKLAEYLAGDECPPLPVVRSIFRSFLGSYPLFPAEQQPALKAELQATLAIWKTSVFYSDEVMPSDLQQISQVLGQPISARLEIFLQLQHYRITGLVMPLRLSAFS